MKSWNIKTNQQEPTPKNVIEFFADIFAVYTKHGLSLSHEDEHGAFIIEPLSQGNVDWLRAAHLDLEPKDPRLVVKFKQWDCYIQRLAYANNGRMCLRLIDVTDGECVVTATTNLTDEPLELNMAAIKDYEENEGVLLVLMQHGIVSPPLKWVRSGHVVIPVCVLTGKVLDVAIDDYVLA